MKETININVIKDDKEKKDAKRKYYFIDGKGLIFMDGKYQDSSLENYFISNNVSLKYRKMIFQNIPFSFKISEYITGVNFNAEYSPGIDNHSVGLIGNSNIIRLYSEGDGAVYSNFTEGISLYSNNSEKVTYTYVINFFREMESDNELKPYIKAITSFMSDGLRCTRTRKILSQINGNNDYDIIEANAKVLEKILNFS